MALPAPVTLRPRYVLLTRPARPLLAGSTRHAGPSHPAVAGDELTGSPVLRRAGPACAGRAPKGRARRAPGRGRAQRSRLDKLWRAKRGGYSANSVRIMRTVLRALSQAEREGIIARNVAALSVPPRVRAGRPHNRRAGAASAGCSWSPLRAGYHPRAGVRDAPREVLACAGRLDWDAGTPQVLIASSGPCRQEQLQPSDPPHRRRIETWRFAAVAGADPGDPGQAAPASHPAS
jgi:hypothetical protein